MFEGVTSKEPARVLIAVSVLALAACSSSVKSGSTDPVGTQNSSSGGEASLSAPSFTVIDHCCTPDVAVPKISATPGGVWPFQDPVYDASDTSVIGSDLGECVRINPSRGSWECRWTTFLPAGQISVEGPYFDTRPSVLTVTGGTESYAGASGSMAMDCTKNALECEYTFNLS